MKKQMMIMLIIFSIFFSFYVKAEPDVFPISTEMQIGKIKNLIDRAPKGILLTVGGERAFREASMFQDVEHLVILDISPTIIRFNNINLELLKAPNKEVYKKLRWESNFSDWQMVSKKLTEDDYKWWNDNIRNIKGYDLPERLNRYGSGNASKYLEIKEKLMSIYPLLSKKYNNYEKSFLSYVTWEDIEKYQQNSKNPLTKEDFEGFDKERKETESCVQQFIDNSSLAVDWGQVIDYKSGNYLFNDKLYQRLHDLSMNNKITVAQADLTKPEDIDKILLALKNLKSKIAVLDLDNLYIYEYMGEEKFRVVLSKLLDYGMNNSILILMNNYKKYSCAQFSNYVGFTFENVRQWPEGPFFDKFIKNIPDEVQPLIDGRLYEKNDKLPFYLINK